MGKTSQYKGVYFDEKSRRWRAFLCVDGMTQYFGRYDTEEQAAKASDWACYKVLGDASGFNLGPLTEANKSDTRTLQEILVQDCGSSDRRYLKKPDASSQYKGVRFHEKSQTWRASLSVDGKSQFFGAYPTEKKAAKAYDWACYKVLGDASGFNLGPLTEANKSDTRTLQEILVQDCRRRRGKRYLKKPDASSSSQYKGVSFHKKSQTWRASLSVDGKQQYFGIYPTEEQAAKACDWARFKVLDDASGRNLGALTEAEKSDARMLKEILLQDCGKRAVKVYLKKPGTSSNYHGVCWSKKVQKWDVHMTHRGASHRSFFRSEVAAAMEYDRLARSLHGEAAVVNFKTPAEAEATIAAEAAAAEGGAGAEPSGDESDDAVDEQPSSDEDAEAEIMREGKRQRQSASPFHTTVPPGANRSHAGYTSVTPLTSATARPRSTTPPPPRLDRDTQWLVGSALAVDTPSFSDEPVFLGAYPELQELFSISKPALEQLASLQRKLQAPPGQIVLELPPELSVLRKAITKEALLFAQDGPGKDGALKRTLQLVEPFLLEAGHVAGCGAWGLRTLANVTVRAGRVLAIYWGDYRTGDELEELQEQELRKRRAEEGPRLRPIEVLSHLLNLDSPFETDLVVDAAPFVSDTCRMKTVAGLINHHSGIVDRPNVCFVPAVRGTGFEPLPRLKLPLCFLVALEDIPPSTEVVVDYGDRYMPTQKRLHQRAQRVKLEEFDAAQPAAPM